MNNRNDPLLSTIFNVSLSPLGGKRYFQNIINLKTFKSNQRWSYRNCKNNFFYSYRPLQQIWFICCRTNTRFSLPELSLATVTKAALVEAIVGSYFNYKSMISSS